MFLFIHGKSAEIDIIMFTDIDYSLKHYKEQKIHSKQNYPKQPTISYSIEKSLEGFPFT